QLLEIQKDLVGLMGELATEVGDLERYVRDGYPTINRRQTARLESAVAYVEAQKVSFKGWATPGASVHSATLDVARAPCRPRERRVCALEQDEQLRNKEIIVYLNRLSDLLWLLARRAEQGKRASAKSVRKS